jgi:hypothetical protein
MMMQPDKSIKSRIIIKLNKRLQELIYKIASSTKLQSQIVKRFKAMFRIKILREILKELKCSKKANLSSNLITKSLIILVMSHTLIKKAESPVQSVM